MRRHLSLAAAILFGLTTATAGDLDPAQVPADAKWVLHFDLDGWNDTRLMEELRGAKPTLSRRVSAWFEQRYGVDPQTDLHGVLMYGRSYRSNTGTVVVHADFDRAKIQEMMKGRGKVEETSWQGHTLYTCAATHRGGTTEEGSTEGGENDGEKREGSMDPRSEDHPHGGTSNTMTIAMIDGRGIVFASSLEEAKNALTLQSEEGGEGSTADTPLFSGWRHDSLAYGAAVQLNQISENDVALPVLQQHERIAWSFGKREDGKLFEEAEFIPSSSEVGNEMEKVLQGVLAYERLWSHGSEALTKLLENATVAREDEAVKVHWEGSAETLIAGIEDAFERLETWKRLFME